jgi:glycosyltransferase involved in cell wall biosynthesis
LAHNVVHVIYSAQHECSAQARIVATLATALDRTQYHLHCCFLRGKGPLCTELERIGVPTHVVGWDGTRHDPAAALNFLRYLRRGRFSLFHQHGGGLVGRWLARAAGVKVNVLHVHTAVSERSGLKPVRVSPRAADAVIATSSAVARCVRDTCAAVIYPGVEVLSNGGVPVKSGYVIGTAARLVPVKGIEYLIRAAGLVREQIPQARLQIAGCGPAQAQLQAEVCQLGLDGCVEFLGWQTPLQPCFEAWDVFALPSLEEAFGLAALEAMVAGLPVVGTAVGGIPELVLDGSTGWLVPPRDPQSLAARLTQLLRDPQLRREMGFAAQARARSQFSSECMIQSIRTIYDSLLQVRR